MLAAFERRKRALCQPLLQAERFQIGILRMQDIISPSSDIFIVKKDNVSIAAAFIYYINNEVCSVIYWGDIEGYSQVKPINYLSYQLIQFYGEKGIKYLDIGISTEDGVPNYGLCDFKDSIGCFPSSKYIFTKFNVE